MNSRITLRPCIEIYYLESISKLKRNGFKYFELAEIQNLLFGDFSLDPEFSNESNIYTWVGHLKKSLYSYILGIGMAQSAKALIVLIAGQYTLVLNSGFDSVLGRFFPSVEFRFFKDEYFTDNPLATIELNFTIVV